VNFRRESLGGGGNRNQSRKRIVVTDSGGEKKSVTDSVGSQQEKHSRETKNRRGAK